MTQRTAGAYLAAFLVFQALPHLLVTTSALANRQCFQAMVRLRMPESVHSQFSLAFPIYLGLPQWRSSHRRNARGVRASKPGCGYVTVVPLEAWIASKTC